MDQNDHDAKLAGLRRQIEIVREEIRKLQPPGSPGQAEKLAALLKQLRELDGDLQAFQVPESREKSFLFFDGAPAVVAPAIASMKPAAGLGTATNIRLPLDRSRISSNTRRNSITANAQAPVTQLLGIKEVTAANLAANNITTVRQLDALVNAAAKELGGNVLNKIPMLMKSVRAELHAVGVTSFWLNRVSAVLCARYILRNYPQMFDIHQFL